MIGVIRAIVFSAIAQVMLLIYLSNHVESTVQAYTDLAKYHAVELVRGERNRMQIQFSREREDMRQFVGRRIDLKINQAMKQK